jgi:hypothetical protein
MFAVDIHHRTGGYSTLLRLPAKKCSSLASEQSIGSRMIVKFMLANALHVHCKQPELTHLAMASCALPQSWWLTMQASQCVRMGRRRPVRPARQGGRVPTAMHARPTRSARPASAAPPPATPASLTPSAVPPPPRGGPSCCASREFLFITMRYLHGNEHLTMVAHTLSAKPVLGDASKVGCW